ncbi:MAG: hypothetical protein QME64_00110, partial [bacterium]|nr:hypothetical protein [bacterium]
SEATKQSMKQYRWLVILAGFITSILGMILVNWYVTLEVRRVKQTIFAAKQAIEQLNMDVCIGLVAEEYTDRWGFNQKTVYEFGKNLFARTKRIGITIDDLEVKVDDSTAQADFVLQVKVILTSDIYTNLELRDVFGTGKQKNNMFVRLVKSPAKLVPIYREQWQISYLGLVDSE